MLRPPSKAEDSSMCWVWLAFSLWFMHNMGESAALILTGCASTAGWTACSSLGLKGLVLDTDSNVQ
jgi:hypothetical protein